METFGKILVGITFTLFAIVILISVPADILGAIIAVALIIFLLSIDLQ